MNKIEAIICGAFLMIGAALLIDDVDLIHMLWGLMLVLSGLMMMLASSEEEY